MDATDITGNRWQAAEAVVLAAAELGPEALDPEKLDAFLDDACAEDGALRDLVENLLGECREVTAEFEQVIEAATPSESRITRPATPPSTPRPAGTRLGPYRLVRLIGEGGGGTVYLARRDDGLFDQRVAIKVLRLGSWSASVRRRFDAERRILARLEHPAIARLIDGGTAPDGSPYLVMELVDGVPIDRFCDRERLGIEERLRLFLKVCAAVQVAHRSLVVHRDLKPANILVTAEGEPKLLDFGVARLLDSDDETHTLVPMTPRWASPEQLRGEPVTTASDTYSLGLLLHSLLTGRQPFDHAVPPGSVGGHGAEMMTLLDHRLQGAGLERPSQAAAQGGDASRAASAARLRRLRPRELQRRLRGDLDVIVTMALREQPSRRYESVGQLAEDVERHLQHRPVRARPESLLYQLSSFVRRHLVMTVTLGLVFLLLTSALVVVRGQSERLARERDRASRVSDLLADLFAAARATDDGGSSVTARELLDRGARRVDELPPSPDTAVLMVTLGHLYARLGLAASAVPLYERALAMQRRALGEHHRELAATWHGLGTARAEVGQHRGARVALARALDLRRRHLGDEHPETVSSLDRLAAIHHALGHFEKARLLYVHALTLARRMHGEEHWQTAATHAQLARLAFDQGRYADAVRRYEHAVSGLDDGEAPAAAVLEAQQGLASALAEVGQAGRALALSRRALEARRSLAGEGSLDLARGLESWGRLLLVAGQAQEAAAPLEEALELRRGRLGVEHAETASSFAALGEQRRLAGQPVDAEMLFRQALESALEAWPAGHPAVADARFRLGALLAESDRCADAEPLLGAAFEARAQLFPAGSWPIAEAEAALAWCQGDGARLGRARAVLERQLGTEHRRTRRLEVAVEISRD